MRNSLKDAETESGSGLSCLTGFGSECTELESLQHYHEYHQQGEDGEQAAEVGKSQQIQLLPQLPGLLQLSGKLELVSPVSVPSDNNDNYEIYDTVHTKKIVYADYNQQRVTEVRDDFRASGSTGTSKQTKQMPILQRLSSQKPKMKIDTEYNNLEQILKLQTQEELNIDYKNYYSSIALIGALLLTMTFNLNAQPVTPSLLSFWQWKPELIPYILQINGLIFGLITLGCMVIVMDCVSLNLKLSEIPSKNTKVFMRFLGPVAFLADLTSEITMIVFLVAIILQYSLIYPFWVSLSLAILFTITMLIRGYLSKFKYFPARKLAFLQAEKFMLFHNILDTTEPLVELLERCGASDEVHKFKKEDLTVQILGSGSVTPAELSQLFSITRGCAVNIITMAKALVLGSNDRLIEDFIHNSKGQRIETIMMSMNLDAHAAKNASTACRN